MKTAQNYKKYFIYYCWNFISIIQCCYY